MRLLFTLLLTAGLSFLTAVQAQPAFFTPVNPDAGFTRTPRSEMPSAFRVYEADFKALEKYLLQAPSEQSPEAIQHNFVVLLPSADGEMIPFSIWQTDVMHPDLGKKFPEIRTYSGEALDRSGRIVHITTSPRGLEAAVRRADLGQEYLEPWTVGQTSGYLVYDTKTVPPPFGMSPKVHCALEDHEMDHPELEGMEEIIQSRGAQAPVSLRTYRLAVATTGHFAQDHGGTVSSVLAVVVDRINKVNLIKENDLALRMQLIANNDQLIFLDPDTDPYTGNSVGDWLGQNPAAINPIIGINSYDIGHVLGRYFTGAATGIATLSSACIPLQKAQGASAATNYGQYFVRVITHEMGHQLSATHIFNSCAGSEANRTGFSAFEPGSGSTIMAYAGACVDMSKNDNLQQDNDDYYNVYNIIQIRNYTTDGNGSQCGTLTSTGNSTPVPTVVSPPNVYIPINTAYELEASGSDPDGDALTFCWEQQDLGDEVNLGQAAATSPLVRSLPPVTSPIRQIPQNSFLISTTTNPQELLPKNSRALNFRVTARDNNAGGGGVDWASYRFYATTQSGPFVVTNPSSSGITWQVGDYRSVTWNVANSNMPPVNCQTVDILLSTNGGQTFPITLATNVPNTGAFCVQVPNNVTNTARIKIRGSGNIFFDISNNSFRIQQPSAAGFSLCLPITTDRACLPGNYVLPVSTSAFLNFSTPIQLSLSGLPSGVEATFSPNPVQPGQTSNLSLIFPGGFAEQTFNVTITGTADAQTSTSTLAISSVNNDLSGFALVSPPNGAVIGDPAPALFWNASANADSFQVELATNPSFESDVIIAAQTGVVVDSFQVTNILPSGQVFYWRVRPVNLCNDAPWSDAFVFGLAPESCQVYKSQDLPKNISSVANVTVESVINVPNNATISDINVKIISGNHQTFGQLTGILVGPGGQQAQLWKNRCSIVGGNFKFGFDDESALLFTCPPLTNSAAVKPETGLSVYDGTNAVGAWTLRVTDNTANGQGKLDSFHLEICASASVNPPVIVNNIPLFVAPGNNEAITTSLLQATDPDNTADQLVYTLVTKPRYGELQRLGAGLLQIGQQFTQSNIDNGDIRYFHYGGPSIPDDFRFVVSDGQGGFVSAIYTITPDPSNIDEPTAGLQFGLFPNPATDAVVLNLKEAIDVEGRVRIFDASGRAVRDWPLVSGQATLRLELNGLPGGVYAVSVQTPQATGAKMLVIRR